VVPGSKAAADLLRWVRKNADADTLRTINRAPNRGLDKPGEYLNDFKPSPTPVELVQNAGSQGTRTANIRYDHIMDGNINGAGHGSGGHYLRSSNTRVTEYTNPADANGVRTGYIQVRNPSNGGWVNKRAETSFFPENWSRRQTTQEIEGAFQNSSPVTLPNGSTGWQGTSPSGVPIRGFYSKPDGGAATAWPVHGG
jgi:filamentous hemagglutinin